MKWMSNNKQIGELNGPWALMFKLNSALIPALFVSMIGGLTWTVRSVYDLRERITVLETWKESRDSVLQLNASALESRVKEAVALSTATKFDSIMDAITELKVEVKGVRVSLEEHKSLKP